MTNTNSFTMNPGMVFNVWLMTIPMARVTQLLFGVEAGMGFDYQELVTWVPLLEIVALLCSTPYVVAMMGVSVIAQQYGAISSGALMLFAQIGLSSLAYAFTGDPFKALVLNYACAGFAVLLGALLYPYRERFVSAVSAEF